MKTAKQAKSSYDKVKEILTEHKQTTAEIVKQTELSHTTVKKYLKVLQEEGYACKATMRITAKSFTSTGTVRKVVIGWKLSDKL